MQNVDATAEFQGLDICRFDEPLDRSYLVKDADVWWPKLEFECLQQLDARGPRFVVWHSLKMFVLPPGERDEFYIPVPHEWDYETNHRLAVSTHVMFSYIADHLRMSGSKVLEHLCRNAGVESAMTTLGSFL